MTRSGATACNSPGFGLIQLIPKSHACPCARLYVSLCMQGGTIGYALLAGRPEYNEKVSVLIQMGPVWYVQYFAAPFLRAHAGPRNPEVSAACRMLLVVEPGAARRSSRPGTVPQFTAQHGACVTLGSSRCVSCTAAAVSRLDPASPAQEQAGRAACTRSTLPPHSAGHQAVCLTGAAAGSCSPGYCLKRCGADCVRCVCALGHICPADLAPCWIRRVPVVPHTCALCVSV